MRTTMRRWMTTWIILSGMLATTAGAYAWGRHQIKTEPATPLVLSGSDIGFRMVGRQGDKIVGQIVVRVNGEWVPTASVWDVKPAKQ